MKNIIKTTAIVVMMALISATTTFANNNPGQLPANPSITVVITNAGCGCPEYGYVTGEWLWQKPGNPYDYKYSGSIVQSYDATTLPTSVVIQSSVSYPNYTAEQVYLTIYQGGDGSSMGKNSKWVSKPFNNTILNPLKCCHCICPGDYRRINSVRVCSKNI